jgi:uncharacterized protein YdeI (YjbR/CyaY-like superfamily)
MTKTNPKVDEFLSNESKWREEFKGLRKIVLECGLEEDLKWGVPCYTLNNKNIVLIHGFKEYCAILFIKGALLHDTNGVLVQQTQNVQAGRQIRFKNAQEVAKMESIIKAYILEAIEIEKSGLEINFKKSIDNNMPEELSRKMDENPDLKTAFEALTPGRQRAYILYFSEPKQEKTRESRIEKYIQHILSGKGLND